MNEEQMHYVIAEAICEIIPDSRRRGRSVIIGTRHFEVHLWLAEATFSISTRTGGRREAVDFDLGDPDSIPAAARAIREWD
jgi:hypothetical protein